MTDKDDAAPKADHGGARRPDHLVRLVLIGLLLAALLAFIIGNTAKTRISFLFVHARFSLIWVLLITNLLGFAAGYLVHGRVKAGRSRRPKH